MDFREYECELIRVVDGDTIDCWIDLGFKVKWKARVRYMGLDTWESRTRDLDEKKKGLAAKARNKELLEQGTFKLKSFGTGKYGRVLGEIFVSPEFVGEHINECITNPESKPVFVNKVVRNFLQEHVTAYEVAAAKAAAASAANTNVVINDPQLP